MSQNAKQKLDHKNLVEVIGILAVIISLLLVAYEVRQNTLAARAAAIQQIGIATAEMWGEFARDPLMIRLLEKRSDIPSEEWTADDWSRFLAQMLAWSRLAETGLLQVEEGLLPVSSLETLGYDSTTRWLLIPEVQCIWEHRLRYMVSESFATYVESGANPNAADCTRYTHFPFFGPGPNSPEMLEK